MSNPEPPPTYSQQEDTTLLDRAASPLQPQVLIVPTTSALGFQKGYLGADNERAAIEGELQVKGSTAGRWGRVTMSLRTVETAPGAEIELASEEVVLFSALASHESAGPSPSAYPFAIPLPEDTPQCLHTPRSALRHTLTATLHPVDAALPKLETAIVVHTRRFATHPRVLHIAPETRTIEEPTAVRTQIPRTTFTAGEAIPIYVTVPAPRRELVTEQGLRLRNVRAELVRVVRLKNTTEDGDADVLGGPSGEPETPGETSASASTAQQKMSGLSSSHSLDLRSIVGVPGGGEVVALSGASCRLHPTRQIQVRLVLHPPHEDTPLVSDVPLERAPASVGELGHPDSSISCGSISQETVLHSVSFIVCVHVTFMHMHSHTERVSSVSIPIVMAPPTAPLPEIEESMDAAYHKKHDRPPTQTNRQSEEDAPGYSESAEAGPSYLNGAPPPFEEREAPPPFFVGPSTSRLPTFQESETEIFVPSEEDPNIASPPPPLDTVFFEGEGTLFGFPNSEQFDGYADQERPLTPPPTLEMATRDPDVTSFATLEQGAALNALELAFEQHHQQQQQQAHDEEDAGPPPPPPPALDDPSDPPPSIDSADFRVPAAAPPRLHASPSVPSVHSMQTDQTPAPPSPTAHGHAPPPYGSSGPAHTEDHDHEHASGPPPYMDLVPGNAH